MLAHTLALALQSHPLLARVGMHPLTLTQTPTHTVVPQQTHSLTPKATHIHAFNLVTSLHAPSMRTMEHNVGGVGVALNDAECTLPQFLAKLLLPQWLPLLLVA